MSDGDDECLFCGYVGAHTDAACRENRLRPPAEWIARVPPDDILCTCVNGRSDPACPLTAHLGLATAP